MVRSNINGYTARFHKLARLVPHMVTPESQHVNRYIRGLALENKANVTYSKPTTIQGVVSMASRLTTNGTVFGEPPCPFDYPTRRLTMEEMLAKFIDEGRRKHEEMDIFIKEFRTTNELLLKTRSNLLSELKIEITSEATHSKESNEIGVNENKPPRFEQDVQEKPHDDGVENKSSSIHERTTQPLNLKQLDINIPFIEALVQIPKYAKFLKSLLTNKSRLEKACTETMNERCSAVLLNELPSKEKDPMSFTTPCQVLEKHKEAEDLAADHLSRFDNPHIEVLTKREIANKFSDDHLMMLKSKFNDV
ncbi:hypothetical protein Tco_0542804 [Tanacetum coccineum]